MLETADKLARGDVGEAAHPEVTASGDEVSHLEAAFVRSTSLLQQRDSPNQTASRIMWNCLYGPSHPYGHITLGTAEAIKLAWRTSP